MTTGKTIRALALGLFLVFGTVLASVPAGAFTLPGRTINTDIIVGFPQHSALPSGDGYPARPSISAFVTTQAPSITKQPASVTVASGTTATFTASANGSPTPSAQWRVSTTSGWFWSNISGATSTTYSFTASSGQNGYRFDVVFSNSRGSVTSQMATLTVTTSGGGGSNSAPKVTQNPANTSVNSGSSASFSAAASGTPTPTVQWQTNSGGSTFSNISNATSTTYSFTASTSQNGWQYRAVFTNTIGNATTNAATLTVTSSAPSLSQSSNWSGYANTSGSFSSVAGTWTVPTVTCPAGSTSYSADWVGIDGWSSNTVEQDGTEADCQSGSPTYDAWYEMYGDNAVNNGYEVELNPSNYPVVPGDTITASVNVSGTTWTLAVSSTRGWNFSTQVSYSGASKNSAEWIVERPEVCNSRCSLTSLANFNNVTFTNSSSSAGPISAATYQAVEMVGSQPLSVPSGLNGSGNGFVCTWDASS